MKIAVIGNIGSGKSEAMKALAELGVHCVCADEINARMLADDGYVRCLQTVFPSVVSNGEVDRRALADLVFSDEGSRAKLNALAHPEIMRRISECGHHTFAAEIPVYIGSGAEGVFDKVIAVVAPLDVRLDRLKSRGLSLEEAKRRIAAQPSDDALVALADAVIVNDGAVDDLRERIKKVAKGLLAQNN